MDEKSQHVLAWHTPTHERGERTPDWYWALGILAVSGVIICVLTGNLIFAGIIGLAALCVGVLAARGPRECVIKIDDRGVTVDGELYPYASLHSFWIQPAESGSKLYLSTHGILHPHIVVEINEPATEEEVFERLIKNIQEEESHSLGTIVAEVFGL